MNLASLTLWVLGLMTSMQPHAPWEASYPATAGAIARVVGDEVPLFEGSDGRARTAALMVSVAWFESAFQPGAVGDCGHAGPCKKGETGQSHGLFQVQGQGELKDPMDAARAALGMLRASMRVCRARPLEERLGWYAAGGNDCDRGLRESRHRVLRAMWLFKRYPPPGESVIRDSKGENET